MQRQASKRQRKKSHNFGRSILAVRNNWSRKLLSKILFLQPRLFSHNFSEGVKNKLDAAKHIEQVTDCRVGLPKMMQFSWPAHAGCCMIYARDLSSESSVTVSSRDAWLLSLQLKKKKHL